MLLKRLAVAATLVLAALTLAVTLAPPSYQINSGINDKVLHFATFAVLVLPCAIFLARYLYWIAPLAVIFGGAIELLQPGFGRDASWADFFADGCGVVAGATVGLALRRVIKHFVAAPK